jgi:hypothetical protein
MMENWQFFLQKEGDYAWLPLETPQVEILEGRYQLIAQTAKAGQSVVVNVRHQYEYEDIPQENIQESIRQIGLSGKVEILPWVYLGLGSWSISCHFQEDQEGAEVQTSEPVQFDELEIQVLSQDFDLFEDWNYGDPDIQEEMADVDKSLEIPVVTESSVEIRPDLLIPVAKLSEGDASDWIVPEVGVAEDSQPGLESFLRPEIDHSHPQVSHSSESMGLLLPNFPASVPSQPFRVVSPTELPRPVSDREIPVAHHSPQLPVFATSRAVVMTKQAQRFRSLTKLRLIGAAVSQRQAPDIASTTLQEKFYSKLNRIAVGAEH